MDWPYVDPFKGDGMLIQDDPWKRVWVAFLDGQFVQCKEERVDPLLEANADALKESEGRKWGDGRRVASIPLGIWWDKIKPARDAGDETYIKRFLNDADNAKFRTFKGKV